MLRLPSPDMAPGERLLCTPASLGRTPRGTQFPVSTTLEAPVTVTHGLHTQTVHGAGAFHQHA